ncbi:MAG: EamA family transporter, partial [Candidatus Aenigmatarchaeota archaeon]
AENVIARKAMIKGETNFIVSFSRMFFGGLILFGVVLLTGKLDVLLALSTVQIRNLLISTALLFGYVLFWYSAIRHINVSKASLFLLLAPVISLVLGVVFLGEPAPLLQLVGSALILVGAWFVIGIKSRLATGV